MKKQFKNVSVLFPCSQSQEHFEFAQLTLASPLNLKSCEMSHSKKHKFKKDNDKTGGSVSNGQLQTKSAVQIEFPLMSRMAKKLEK